VIPIRDINPTERFAIITVLLIAANCVVFLFELLPGSADEALVSTFALVPARLFSTGRTEHVLPVWATIITSMFLHGGFIHVAGNMLYLWIFGNNVEDAMGRMRFLLFYLLCGVIAAYTHAFAHADSQVPMIGASGAVSGILGAYLLLYPRARVLTLMLFGFYVRTFEVPAMFVLGFWFLLQFLNALLMSGGGMGVAWYAHVGGFVAGIILIGLFKRRSVTFGGRKRDRYL
jgi:membrane associated rhomboid family serine protease